MTETEEQVVSATADSNQAKESSAPQTPPAKKQRPTRILPTERITWPRHFEILRGFAALSGPNLKPVSNNEVGAIVGMTANTISLANAFFVDTKLLTRTEKGMVPAPEVFQFLRAFEWDKVTAAHKLAPIISNTWFADPIVARLSFRQLELKAALAILAEEASASPEYEANLFILLQYLQAVGLIVIEGNTVRAVQAEENKPPPQPPGASNAALNKVSSEGAHNTVNNQPPKGNSSGGAIDFNVSVNVSVAELSGWTADRITAFFGGVAQVLAAKKGTEAKAE